MPLIFLSVYPLLLRFCSVCLACREPPKDSPKSIPSCLHCGCTGQCFTFCRTSRDPWAPMRVRNSYRISKNRMPDGARGELLSARPSQTYAQVQNRGGGVRAGITNGVCLIQRRQQQQQHQKCICTSHHTSSIVMPNSSQAPPPE